MKSAIRYVLKKKDKNEYLSEMTSIDDFFEDIGMAALFTKKEMAERCAHIHECETANDEEPLLLDVVAVKIEIIEEKDKEVATKWYVYLVKEKNSAIPNYKIGYTSNLDERIKQLQTGHPLDLGYAGLFEFTNEKDAHNYEQFLHDFFKKDRIRVNGEWFIDNSITEFITWNHENHVPGFIRYIS